MGGIYSLQTPGDKWPHLSFCNMGDYNGYEDDSMESSIGYINIEPENEKIVFSVYSSSAEVWTSGHYVDFDNSMIENGFPLSGNSEFIAPFKGNYEFTFTGNLNHNYDYRVGIQVQLNGADVYDFYTKDDSSGVVEILSSSWILSLDVGDSIRLYIRSGSLYTDPGIHRTFTG